MHITLAGKAALVTGAGRGIGRAIALQLGEAGAEVMVNDLDAGAAAETADLVRTAGGKAESLAGDVTVPAFPQQLVDATLASFRSVDIIVNNAGYTWDNV